MTVSDDTMTKLLAFLAEVHGLNEMNVVRGVRKILQGENTSFEHEVRLSVYGPPCGHQVPSTWPKGYGTCDLCKYGEEF